MDADNSPIRTPATRPGGTVEPANRATTAKERSTAAPTSSSERYELRDPFNEVTYRADTFREIVAKAEQLGSSRFVAVTDDGKRTLIQKVDGAWQRGPQRPTSPERPLDGLPTRDEVPEASNPTPMPGSAKAPHLAHPSNAKSNARNDAQAERAALVARLEAALQERYIIKRAPVMVGDVTIGSTEYRFRGDTSRLAFTESTFRLATDNNSPSVARSMVDVAEARGWKALRISGHEDFRRMVWLEATVRDVKTQGYEPTLGDMELLKREREARLVNRIEPAREVVNVAQAASTEKASNRGSGGRKAVLAAIDALLVAKKVPEKQRVAVMDAATERLAQRIREGQSPKVKVFDKAAPSRRPVIVPAPEQQRSRDRAAPAPAR